MVFSFVVSVLAPFRGLVNGLVPFEFRGGSFWATVTNMDEPKLHATGLHPTSLAAQLFDFVNANRLGLLGLAAAADVIAAECRFNYWFLTDLKRRPNLSEDSVLRLLDNGEINDNRCKSAMAAFASGDLSVEQFCAEMAAVAAFLNKRAGA